MVTHFYGPKKFAQVVQQLEEAGLTIEEAIVRDPQDDTIQQIIDRLKS